MLTEVKIKQVRVDGRHRQHMGNIDELANSIEEIGLLHPIVIDKDNNLIAGQRRLWAVRQLGWETVPANVVDYLDDATSLLIAERDENTCRKEFTPSEAVVIGRRLAQLEKSKAKERQGGPGRDRSGKLPEQSKAQTRDKVGQAVGMSGKSFEKAKVVVESGDKDAIAEMDRTGKVDRAFRNVTKKQELKRKAEAAKAAPQPTKQNKPCEWSVIHGDCVKELAKISKARLVFADPPYNIGIDYGQGKEADKRPDSEFLRWTKSWIRAAIECLTADGSLWILINDEWAAEIAVIVKELGMHRRAWIKWYETFGVNCSANFNRTSRHLFYFVRNQKRFVFNESAVQMQSARAAKYNDNRASADGLKLMDDVWQIPRLTGTCKERMPDFPTQLPEELLMRVVGCASNEGDLVVDPFNGSGTTGVVSKRLGRKYIGIEKEEKFWELAKLRIAGEGY